MVSEIVVPKRVLDELASSASCARHEVAAMLFGRYESGRAIVARAEFVELSERSPTYFVADPEHVYSLYLQADERGEELVAIFHSHPAAPSPSPRDLEFMKLNPVPWLIYSTMTGGWGAYQFARGELRELLLKVV